MAVAAGRLAIADIEPSVANRADRARAGIDGWRRPRLTQPVLDPVAQQQVDPRHDAQRLQQAHPGPHPACRRDIGEEFERGAVEHPSLDGEAGTLELAPPEAGGAGMVLADRRAAIAAEAGKPLADMLDPEARAVGGGDDANPARLQHPVKLGEDDRRVLDMLDDLVRADIVEDAGGERHRLQRRLEEPRALGDAVGGGLSQPQRRDVDPEIAQPRHDPRELTRLVPRAASGIEQGAALALRKFEQPVEIVADQLGEAAFPQHPQIRRVAVLRAAVGVQSLAGSSVILGFAAEDVVRHRPSIARLGAGQAGLIASAAAAGIIPRR